MHIICVYKVHMYMYTYMYMYMYMYWIFFYGKPWLIQVPITYLLLFGTMRSLLGKENKPAWSN